MKKTIKIFFRFFSVFSVSSVAIILFSCAQTFAQNKIVVRVSAETIVENERLELGALAQISGASDKTERLKKISLGYSPNLGMAREISRLQIALAINAAGFSDEEFSLNSPAKILVRRAGQQIADTQIREAVEKAISNQFSDGRVETRIVRLDAPANIMVPVGNLEIRARLEVVRNLFEKFSLPVEIRVDGKLVRTLAATLEVVAFAEIFVAANDLSVNAKISETDVKFEKRRIVKPLTNYLREAENLRGLTLIKNIAAGAEITTDFFVAGVVIKSGDAVSIEAKSGNLKLIVSGTARSSGKIGDRISVVNSQSGAVIQATVVDEGLVRVAF